MNSMESREDLDIKPRKKQDQRLELCGESRSAFSLSLSSLLSAFQLPLAVFILYVLHSKQQLVELKYLSPNSTFTWEGAPWPSLGPVLGSLGHTVEVKVTAPLFL